jgi:hypothetical protein
MLPNTTVRYRVASVTPTPELENHSVRRIYEIDTLTLSTTVTKEPGTPSLNLKCLVSRAYLRGICNVFPYLINRYKIYRAWQPAPAQVVISNSTPPDLYPAIFTILGWTIQQTFLLPVLQIYLCSSSYCWLCAHHFLVSVF